MFNPSHSIILIAASMHPTPMWVHHSALYELLVQPRFHILYLTITLFSRPHVWTCYNKCQYCRMHIWMEFTKIIGIIKFQYTYTIVNIFKKTLFYYGTIGVPSSAVCWKNAFIKNQLINFKSFYFIVNFRFMWIHTASNKNPFQLKSYRVPHIPSRDILKRF